MSRLFVGVVEGFYGPTWSLLDRLSVISFMGRTGLNIYVYGPKQDPYHRDSWRDPYPLGHMEEFSRIIEWCNRHSVYFAYAISPGLDIDYSSREDLGVLVSKLERFLELGVRVLGLFLDDIPPVVRGTGLRTLAEAQARLANYVYRELSPDKMIFVPTYYWGYEESYLRELGELLDTGVEIVWTGRYVVSPTITLEDIERFREVSGRYPFIWDNYPVNDFFMFRGVVRLHMDYVKGRDPRIMSYVRGYMANPMNQAEASKIPLYSVSILSRGRSPREEDLDRAVELVVEEEVWDAYKLFVRLNRSSVLDPTADYEPGPGDSGRLLDMVERLRRGLRNKKLLSEISPVLSLIETLARSLGSGEKLEKISRRVQAAGLYDPPIPDESMKRVFGHVPRRIPSWAS